MSKKTLEELFYEVHVKTEELYELKQEIDEKIFEELNEEGIEHIEKQLNTLDELIEGLDKFNQSIDIFDETIEIEPDGDYLRDVDYFENKF